MMIIFYRDRDGTVDNYSFDITESGIIICNNKQYQIKGIQRRFLTIFMNGSKIKGDTSQVSYYHFRFFE